MRQDLARSFKDEGNRVVFIGERCICRIPLRYSDQGFLSQEGDIVSTLGIMEVEVDGKEGGLFIAAIVHMAPDKVTDVTIDGKEYKELEFKKNDVFLTTKEYIVNDRIPYYIWVEFITLGRIPKYINYDNIHQVFPRISEVTGVTFNVNQSIFGLIYAQQYRDRKRPFVRYRNTPMDQEPIFIGLKNVAYGPDDTLSKLLGNYESASLNSALINESDRASDIEIVLRS